MDTLSVKGSDVSLSLTGSKRTNSRPGAVTDDFRALLTGKQTNSQDTKDSKEISKDTKDIKDTDQETDQATNDTKKDPVSEEQSKTDKVEESDKQTEGLMAAYQVSQGMRPEIIQIAPETAEEAAPEIVVDTDAKIELQTVGAEETAAIAQPEQNTEVANVQAQAADLGLQKEAPQQTDNDTADGTVSEVQPVIPETDASETKQETADLTSSQSRDRDKTVQAANEGQAQQTENTSMAENGAPVAADMPRTEKAEAPKYETVATVHVEQPEELPEKVTNQLLSKLVELSLIHI